MNARRLQLNRAVALIAEVDQIFADCAHWNRTHPEEDPIDPDADGGLRAARAKAQRLVDRITEEAPDA